MICQTVFNRSISKPEIWLTCYLKHNIYTSVHRILKLCNGQACRWFMRQLLSHHKKRSTTSQLTYLLRELSVRDRLATKLDVQCIGSRYARSVENADRTVAVIHYVDVDIATTGAAYVTRDITVPSVSSVDIDYTFLTDRDCGTNSIWTFLNITQFSLSFINNKMFRFK